MANEFKYSKLNLSVAIHNSLLDAGKHLSSNVSYLVDHLLTHLAVFSMQILQDLRVSITPDDSLSGLIMLNTAIDF